MQDLRNEKGKGKRDARKFRNTEERGDPNLAALSQPYHTNFTTTKLMEISGHSCENEAMGF